MIETVELKNFRRFSNFKLDCHHKTIILTGPNAVGKTTILEAIYLVATSKSHRTNDSNAMIQYATDFAVVEVTTSKKYKIVLSKLGKQYQINQVSYSKTSDFIGDIPVILFSPTDIELVQGSKSARRQFLDLEISLLDKVYLREIMVYKKLLKERNELLKTYKEENKLILDVITKQLCEKIKGLYLKRIQFVDQLNTYLNEVCDKLECEQIKITYQPSYDIKQIESQFNHKLPYDIISKMTNIGLHRDDFGISIENQEAKSYASEGQTRMIVIALKLALKEIYKKQHEEVILLLDDVFASLDQKRMNHIMNYIKNENQTIITTTSLFHIPDELLKDAKIVKL